MDIIISANDEILQMMRELPLDKTGKVDFSAIKKLISSFGSKSVNKTDTVNKNKASKRDNATYKPSVFNYVLEKTDYVLVYNTLYNSLARFSKNEYKQFLSEGKLAVSLYQEIEDFVENGFLIESEIDEKAKYFAFAEVHTNMPRPISVTIAPTLRCNARCQYCYEKGVRQFDIYKGAEDRIIDFIKQKTIDDKVYITWLGGEPLMNSDFIDSFSAKLKRENINFRSYIITNGSLLSKEIIEEKFALWNVANCQITLDGTKKRYEAIKGYSNPEDGEFYKILDAIRAVSKTNVFVNVRLNIDRQNKEDILELVKELDSTFANEDNVVFYPAFLTGSQFPLTENEKLDYIKEMLDSVVNIRKITASTKFYSPPRMHACMNGDPHSFVIDVNGNIFTCDHAVGKAEKAIGNIERPDLINDNRVDGAELRDDCLKCVFLPKCYGGCKSNYLEGDDPCMIEKYVIKAYIKLL